MALAARGERPEEARGGRQSGAAASVDSLSPLDGSDLQSSPGLSCPSGRLRPGQGSGGEKRITWPSTVRCAVVSGSYYFVTALTHAGLGAWMTSFLSL